MIIQNINLLYVFNMLVESEERKENPLHEIKPSSTKSDKPKIEIINDDCPPLFIVTEPESVPFDGMQIKAGNAHCNFSTRENFKTLMRRLINNVTKELFTVVFKNTSLPTLVGFRTYWSLHSRSC